MNSESSMRAIEPVLRDLILHIQNLESENRKLRNTIYQQSHKLASVTEEAKALSFQNTRLAMRMEDATKCVKAICRREDNLSAEALRRLWNALEFLGE